MTPSFSLFVLLLLSIPSPCFSNEGEAQPLEEIPIEQAQPADLYHPLEPPVEVEPPPRVDPSLLPESKVERPQPPGETVQVWYNGGNNTGNEPSAIISIAPFLASGDFSDFLWEVETQLPFIGKACNLTTEPPIRCHPWSLKIYNWQRHRIVSTSQLHGGDLLYVVPVNESFIWPGLYVGHKVTISVPEHAIDGSPVSKSYTLTTVSLIPRAFTVEDFLTDEEAEKVIEVGSPSLAASTLGEEATLSTTQRNSRTAWLGPHSGPDIKKLCDRASFLTHTPVAHQEALQLLHYPTGGFYRSHCDYFGEPGCTESPSRFNRFVTMVFYLRDVEEGGGTNFWRVKAEGDTDDPWLRDTANVTCQGGLTTQPLRRKALIFYNLYPFLYRETPKGDKLSEHTACNVTKGEKWAANFWIWNHPRLSPDTATTYADLDKFDVYVPTPSGDYFPGELNVGVATATTNVATGAFHAESNEN